MVDPTVFEQLSQILFSYQQGKVGKVRSGEQRFAHYTSAHVGLSILDNEEVWMRRADTMNDYLEVDYGLQCLSEAFKSTAGDDFKEALDSTHEGLTERMAGIFDGLAQSFKTNTYLTCVSEHDDDEDEVGRLSMWRAYGGANGVAMVFHGQPFGNTTDALKAYSGPVEYLSKKQFALNFATMGKRLLEQKHLLALLDPDAVVNVMVHVLRFSVLCTKHVGFYEEKEWRVIHSPAIHSSEALRKKVEVINGVPQLVMKIPLKNIPDQGLTGIEIPEFLSRIIIGPSRQPHAIREAFVEKLKQLNVPNAAEKVIVSNIPLRM